MNILKPTIPPLLLIVADVILMIAGSILPEWLLGMVLGASLLWVILAAKSVRKNVIKRWPWMRSWFPFLDSTGGLATSSELTDIQISSKALRLTDLAVNGVIANRTFDDCIIYGPAVVAPTEFTVFRYPSWQLTRGDLYYELKDMKTRTGMILLENCTFNRCTFYDIGVVGNDRKGFYAQLEPKNGVVPKS